MGGGGRGKKSTGDVDRLGEGCIIIQLNGDKFSALFNKMIKIICVGACDGMFSRRLNIRHKNHDVNSYLVIYV